MDTKEKILDAAERLFAEHGFASTSMRDITTEADVNLAAVNYHFGSKLALLQAVRCSCTTGDCSLIYRRHQNQGRSKN